MSSRESKRHDDPATIDRGVREAVIAGLSHFATGTALDALIYLLEVEHSVDFNFVSDNPTILRSGLIKMFGSAEEVIESRICEALRTHFQIATSGKLLEEVISRIKSHTDPKNTA
ncbi:MAG: hypothetical protein JRN20_14325 [Nitrososphaerota archaeon]|nr:hypothetical protein [Nitrososphaerota archaeon]